MYQTIEEDVELLQVQVIFRHGARTPLWVLSSDRYRESDFPEGLGNLSKFGKEQMSNYGKILRERYSQFIDGIEPHNINTKSSPVDRCQESASHVLNNLLPTTKKTTKNPISIDRSLGEQYSAEAYEMHSRIENSKSFHKFLEQHRDFLQKLSQTNDPEDCYWDAIGLHDSLTCQKAYFGDRFIGPKWLGESEWDRLNAIRSYHFGRVSVLPKRYFQLEVGKILKEICDNLTHVHSKSEIHRNRLFNIYSTHDTLIAPLSHALGIYKETPSFGSGFIVELWQNRKTNTHHVHLYEVNGMNNFEIKHLDLTQSETFKPHCSEEQCSLDNFLNALQDYLP